jgi:trans-aconitate methyltransferase
MPEQTWDPNRYARNARFVADLGVGVVELLNPQPGERILDLGCGDGALTRKLVELGCEVVGVDSSPQQIEAARTCGLDARLKDCQALDFEREFDAVFSNAALHWMKRPDAVLEGVKRALRPGGRFVAELGGAGCVKQIRTAVEEALSRRGIDGAARNPWYFPSAEDYGAKLKLHGFEINFILLFNRPTELPGELTDWLETFAEPYTSALPQAERSEVCREVQEILRPHLCDAKGRWQADYVRLRFAATLKKEEGLGARG